MDNGAAHTGFKIGGMRIAALIAVLVLFGVGLIGAVPVSYVQVVELAAVLVAAMAYGLWVGLSAATVGFAILLWRHFQEVDGLTLGSIIGSLLWFAVAKFAAALIAYQRTHSAGQQTALLKAEDTAVRNSLLLQEMRHRTRNDMQRLVGILSSQARAAPQAAEPLQSAVGHVVVMSRLHERLALRTSEGVDTRVFLRELVNDLRSVVEPDRAIAIVADAEHHNISSNMAADLGLILNELVTNALKHGFPHATKGVIRLNFRRIGDMFELVVADNGVGASASQTRNGSGQSLLHALAAQLGGRLSIERAEVGGTQCLLVFPVNADADFVDNIEVTPTVIKAPEATRRAS